jgi:hypothetical protein
MGTPDPNFIYIYILPTPKMIHWLSMLAALLLGGGCGTGISFSVAEVQLNNGVITTLVGRQGVSSPFSDGIRTSATFDDPRGVALNTAGTSALVVRIFRCARPARVDSREQN